MIQWNGTALFAVALLVALFKWDGAYTLFSSAENPPPIYIKRSAQPSKGLQR